MARARTRIEFNHATFENILKSPEVQADMEARAARIAVACNAQSSWGGYASAGESSGDRAGAKVWSYGANDDEARQQRLAHNLDA